MNIQGLEGITLLSAGTDGPADAAGAVVDGTTKDRAVSPGLDPLNI